MPHRISYRFAGSGRAFLAIGVLHHLPDPEEGFRALISRLRPGGAVSAWVYGREGNGWIVHIVSPIRQHVTSRMPHRLLDFFSAALTAPLFLATKLVYGPAKGRLLGVPLPYGPYLSYLAGFPYREQRSIVFDHLVAPVAHYIPRGEFAQWFEQAGLEVSCIEHHNGNSWRGFARVPAGSPTAITAPSQTAMCGIAGYAALDPRRHPDGHPVHAMLGHLAHRGPDDEGVHTAAGVVLGHRRLSIIDPAGGHQPLFGATESTVIICNGEVYNYRELRRELEAKGHRVRTASDTEVAGHSYDEWGFDFLERLDGMFGLALWDGAGRRLVLARDRLGEKPLYWTVAGGLLIFGSELTAVLAHPAFEPEIDPVALSAYLALEYVPAPRSILRRVSKLEPGTVLTLENGCVDVHPYW